MHDTERAFSILVPAQLIWRTAEEEQRNDGPFPCRFRAYLGKIDMGIDQDLFGIAEGTRYMLKRLQNSIAGRQRLRTDVVAARKRAYSVAGCYSSGARAGVMFIRVTVAVTVAVICKPILCLKLADSVGPLHEGNVVGEELAVDARGLSFVIGQAGVMVSDIATVFGYYQPVRRHLHHSQQSGEDVAPSQKSILFLPCRPVVLLNRALKFNEQGGGVLFLRARGLNWDISF
jgi:hypothetical protein